MKLCTNVWNPKSKIRVRYDQYLIIHSPYFAPAIIYSHNSLAPDALFKFKFTFLHSCYICVVMIAAFAGAVFNAGVILLPYFFVMLHN